MQRVEVGTSSSVPVSVALPRVERSQMALELRAMRDIVGDRRVWHVNSAAHGGGVAELLSSLLPHVSDVGIDVRWMVIDGTDAFFEFTKRIHNRLHDDRGDGGPLDEEA